jgi:hypothetical protein
MGTKIPLKRELGLPEVTLSGIGIILGAGIYALIGRGADLAGNALWLSFTISAAIAVLTGLSYAELSAMFPLAGAEYEYVKGGTLVCVVPSLCPGPLAESPSSLLPGWSPRRSSSPGSNPRSSASGLCSSASGQPTRL